MRLAHAGLGLTQEHQYEVILHMEWLMTNWTTALQGVLAVLGGFSILAKLTPTEADDALVDKILAVIHAFGLTKTK